MPIIFLKWCDWNILEVIIHFKSQKLSGNNLITVAWTSAAQEAKCWVFQDAFEYLLL